MQQPHSSNRTIPSPLVTQLDSRDVALWLGGGETEATEAVLLASLVGLPWNVVLTECSSDQLLGQLEAAEDINAPLVRRRGLVHIVDTDPAETILPPRHLAVLLLNGRAGQRRTGLAALTRRLTMLQDLRRRSIKQLVVAVPGQFSIPDDLNEMWSDGFRTTITFVSDDPGAEDLIREWQREFSAPLVDLIRLSPLDFGSQLQTDYLRGRDGALVYRARNERGEIRNVEAANIDDPENPLLGSYELIGSEALSPLLPSDLSASEVDAFFSDSSASWRPYAAGMAWERDRTSWETLRNRLRALDRKGSEENRILYVAAESGAGATVFIRDLAWRAANEGYPTLVADPRPTATSGLEMANFLTRLVNTERDPARLYEVPCLLVFDQIHWEGRDAELLSFAREIERSGRRVCILVATGTHVGLGVLTERKFVSLSSLSHRVPAEQAFALGRHLNRFLAPHGTDRSENEWRDFFRSSSMRDGQNIAAFWIVLSFWLQRQINLGETVQSRVYRQFIEFKGDENVKIAILRIAAFSTVRLPLPDALLPETADWPIREKLEDVRRDLGALGLIRINGELDRYWAMAHDVLGRYLLTALFYDTTSRKSFGLESASNPEHLRFLILRQISAIPRLGRADLRDVADTFAVSIFKIDPDHGYGSLAPYWREALEALDEMPRSIRTTSRTFLHHSAISRRRIASDRLMFSITDEDRVELLLRAVDDLKAALRLDSPAGGETDLGLYNSLAQALHDLVEAQSIAGASALTIAEARTEAQEATKRAYSLNPDNSFVVETYARALLSEGIADTALAVSRALEVLALAYNLMERPGFDSRRAALTRLAEKAFELLKDSGGAINADPDSEAGAIARALSCLARGVGKLQGLSLAEVPEANRQEASELLASPALAGNVQAIKLRYMLTVLDRPSDFDLQLELLQSLHGSGPAFTPQMELELGVLLFQNDRSHEGDRVFRRLRNLWRKGEHYVEVPTRLHWLLDSSRADRRQVRAKVATGAEGRAFARVSDFQNIEVPFRTAEFNQEHVRPGTMLAGYVSFGHNGPLLRPLTAPRR